MKAVLSVFLVFALAVSAVLPTPVSAEPRQLIPGTEIHLTLLTPVSSSTSREGDPFIAVLAQPVALDSRIILPAGTRIHGVVGTIQKAKSFSLFRGQAYMNLAFKSIELDNRLIPLQMSIVAIGHPRIDSYSTARRDVKIIEGEVVQEKHDYKGDAYGMAIGGGGGTLMGVLFSNVARGIGIGFAAGAVYVVARKGREVELPAQTGLLTRIDSTLTVPQLAASNSNDSPNDATASR
ncbi:MAG TPA: hypothetical protein VGP66_01630 [Candidatus Acidoferrum sp.]|jgi:hypothetical protein|nr:hypothetical protein [Candidatus Acidoferrum sp.]